MKNPRHFLLVLLTLVVLATIVGADLTISLQHQPKSTEAESTVSSRFSQKNVVKLVGEQIDISKRDCLTKTLKRDPRRQEKLQDPSPKQFLVHVKHPVKDGLQDVIEQITGSRIVAYVPENTFIVATSLEKIVALGNHEDVLWIGDYRPQFKLSPELNNEEFMLKTKKTQKGVLVVTLATDYFARTTTKDLAISWAQHLNELVTLKNGKIQTRAESARVLHVAIPKEEVTMAMINSVATWIAKQPQTHFVEPMIVMQTLNREAGRIVQAGFDTGEAGPFHKIGIKGTGQVVGVADTGIDYSQCYFNDPARLPKMTSINRDYSHDWSYYLTPDTADDAHRKVKGILAWGEFGGTDFNDYVNGHGTHVAGSIVGKCTDPQGSAYDGVAPEAKICFMDSQDNTDGMSGAGLNIKLIDEVTMYWPHFVCGSRIHSHSWGATAPGYNIFAVGFDKFSYMYNTSTAFVAAGNEGMNSGSGSINVPGSAKNVIAVGASMNSYNAFVELAKNTRYWENYNELSLNHILANPSLYHSNVVAGFSSRGPTGDNRIKPDILAPGYYVVSARSDGNASSANCEFKYNGGTLTQCVNDCSGRGQCVQNEYNFYYCRCPAGYCSSDCSVQATYDYYSQTVRRACCGPDTCNGHGSCFTNDDDRANPFFYCSCDSGYGGQFCETKFPENTNRGHSALLRQAGTSMATPIAAGMAALVRQYFLQGYYPNPSAPSLANSIEPTNALMKAIFINSARPLSQIAYISSDYSKYGDTLSRAYRPPVTVDKYVTGHGLIGLNRTIPLPGSSHSLWFTQSYSLRTDESNVFCFKVTNPYELKVTLVWTDPEASSAATKLLINDLDLEVVAGGRLYLGNNLTITMKNRPGEVFSVPDDTNNVEEVHLPLLSTNDLVKVSVKGYNVPVRSPQGYALVVTGKFSGPSQSNCPLCYIGEKQACSDATGSGYKYCQDGSSFGVCTYTTCNNGLVLNAITNACETPGTVLVTASTTSLVIDEGTTGSYTLKLAQLPTSNVDITAFAPARVQVKNDQETSYSSSTLLTFTPANYNQAQTITVLHPLDQQVLGNYADFVTHTISSTDASFNIMNAPRVSVQVIEKNVAGIKFNTTSIALSGAVRSAAAKISLSTKPRAPVQLLISSSNSAIVRLNTSPSTLDVGTSALVLQFDANNWNVDQTVTAYAESLPSAAQSVILTVTTYSADASYNNMALPSVSVTIQK